MIKEARDRQLAAIFSLDKEIYYEIPKYQREYSWGKKDCGILFDDIVGNDKGYFLGSIIYVSSEQTALSNPVKVQVIDGQQRLTSLSILLLAIYDKLKNLSDQMNEDQRADLINLKKRLVWYDKMQGTYASRIIPQSQNYNCDDYYCLLSEKGFDIENVQTQQYRVRRKIYKAFNIFTDAIDDFLEEKKQENPDTNDKDILFDLYDKVINSIIVTIEVETSKDAYMLFESLNKRGIPLSAIDLIKNSLISKSDDPNDKTSVEKCYNRWKNILAYLNSGYSQEKDYVVQERFFRQYYNAYREELNQPYESEKIGKIQYPLGYLATKSTMLDIYDRLIKDDYKNLMNNLEFAARTYSIIIGTASDDCKIEKLETSLINLANIEGTPSYLLLMYLISNKERLELSVDLLKDLIDYLVKYFVRRSLTDFPATRNITKVFMDAVAITNTYKGTELISKIKEHLKHNSASDTVFEGVLNGPVYQQQSNATRFLLCYYEEQFKTKENNRNLWERDEKNIFVYTIEHIFPEGDNIPKEWIDMIANGDKKLAETYLDAYAHTLGNLTLTAYNSNLSNKSFTYKRDRTDKKGNYIGYRNGLKLNDDVLYCDVPKKSIREKWTIEDIKTRTKTLVNYFKKEFKL